MAPNVDTTVLGKKYRPTAKFLLALGGLFTLYSTFGTWDAGRAKVAALEVIAPVEKRIDKHITETEALRPVMLKTVDDLHAAQQLNARNQYRICLKLRIECEPP